MAATVFKILTIYNVKRVILADDFISIKVGKNKWCWTIWRAVWTIKEQLL
jgi:hypothetical protein